MKRSKTHPFRLLLRRPYKILLCCLACTLVVLFTVVEAAQMIQTRQAMNEAMASRIYTGTLARTDLLQNRESDLAIDTFDGRPIGEEAAAILQRSPYVSAVRSYDIRSGRLGDDLRYVDGIAARSAMFVGRFGGRLQEPIQPEGVNNASVTVSSILFKALYVAAGDPDALPTKNSETIPLQTLRILNPDPDLQLESGQRFFLFSDVYHMPGQAAWGTTANTLVEGQYYPVFVLATEEDAELSDEEFAAKVIKEYELEEIAAFLNDSLSLVTVAEIPTVEMLLPYRNGLMRIMQGRGLTEEDAGKKVCILPNAMMARIRKRVGQTVKLAVADGAFHDGGYEGHENIVTVSGVPTNLWGTNDLTYGEYEEYEIVGSFIFDETAPGQTQYFYTDYILIPRSPDAPYEPVSQYQFSFTVHKDDYENFLFKTEPLLNQAGYTVIMARPDYADVEEQFQSIQDRSLTSFLTAALALATGLAIASGSLVLFWRSDYLTERKLGARKREAGGLYAGAYVTVALVSLALSALTLYLFRNSKSIPFLSDITLDASVLKTMALFAGADLLVVAAIAFLAVLGMDRRKIGG